MPKGDSSVIFTQKNAFFKPVLPGEAGPKAL